MRRRFVLLAGVTLLACVSDPAWPQTVGPSLELRAYPRLQGPISERTAAIPPAVVTVLNAATPGFGVFVSEDGLILTNQQVVGDAETVGIRLINGTELNGRVLRRHTTRNVALVKIDGGRTPTLPLRLEPLGLSEEVYTLGSPDDPNLGGTVTRGAIRARHTTATVSGDLPMMQSDATVYGGGSGGPLLDASGNVVGIAATSVPTPNRSTTLNFFIPIGDALRYLNIHLAQPR